MKPIFPSSEWLQAVCDKLNSDERYARIARKWEGDMAVIIEPSGPVKEKIIYYIDPWHGSCRKVEVLKELNIKPTFVLQAPYENLVKILTGELDPMQALMTRKLGMHGNMAVMMRNIPVVLDFVRCAREATGGILS